MGHLWTDERGARWGEERQHPEVPLGYVDAQLKRALLLLDGELIMPPIPNNDRAKHRNG